MAQGAYKDIELEIADPVALLRLDRPQKLNAFTYATLAEIRAAVDAASADPRVVGIVITGNGRGFCAGLDAEVLAATAARGSGSRAQPPAAGDDELPGLFSYFLRVPKPVIAAVNGVAVGGGHVLHVLCDITIAAEHARFGQAGPRVGSFDAGFGSAYLARILGEKRAREVWYLCRLYDAATMERWGLVNRVVPKAELRAEVRRWADEMLAKSPTALKVLKHSFNADSEAIAGIGTLAFDSLELFVRTPEAREGVSAFNEKRTPDFSKYRG